MFYPALVCINTFFLFFSMRVMTTIVCQLDVHLLCLLVKGHSSVNHVVQVATLVNPILVHVRTPVATVIYGS